MTLFAVATQLRFLDFTILYVLMENNYWRASKASEKLLGVTNGNRRYIYIYIYIYGMGKTL